MKNLFLVFFILVSIFSTGKAQDKHKFEFSGKDFLLDGKPFQIIGGEMHPARIPYEYWRHRIQMAKAMGCNTISAYLFWNYHEIKPGQFDFKSENRDIAEFIRIVKEEGMWLIIRPGPYACAEWDFGGLPAYLLKNNSGEDLLEGKYSNFEVLETVAVPAKIEVMNRKQNETVVIDYKSMTANKKKIYIDFKLPDDASIIKW